LYSIPFVTLLVFTPLKATYLNRKAEGWHWYEKQLQKKRHKKREKRSKESAQEALKELRDLKAKLEAYKARAVMNPTFSHVKAYMTLQKEVLEKASRFAATWLEVVYRTPSLDYGLKKPTSQAGRQLYLSKEQSALKADIKALSQTHGLFFFFAGSCSWCHHFAPIVKRFGEQYGLKILAISLDGGRLKEFPEAQRDNGIAKKLGVKALPALMAVNPKTGQTLPLAYGFVTIDQIEERIKVLYTRSFP
jgi:conjugal transfer pilus assembly protein TraF